MVLSTSQISPFERVFVAVDLETTGLDSSRDTILEVGAVKFQGDSTIDTFQTFVNPGRAIPEFIQRLTHIRPDQVRRAPFFNNIADSLADFIGPDDIVGHNIAFDVGFLASQGLTLNNTSHDTWDLATVLMPRAPHYSLAYLARHFGVNHEDAHRALADARATQGVFLHLLRMAQTLDPGLLDYIVHLSTRSRWPIGQLLSPLGNGAHTWAPSSVGLTGLDMDHLKTRLARPERRRTNNKLEPLDEARIVKLLGPEGPFAASLAGFEYREEQETMLEAVSSAMYHGQHLTVEGGTGVGKSMSYLLPAVLFSVSQGQRVVISTNTINLQEQLLQKDIPAVVGVLEKAGLLEKDLLKVAVLKGRSNYLCLRRLGYLARSDNPTLDDARLLSKTAVWLQDTVSGDRGEINLAGRDGFTWSRISAGDQAWCPGLRDAGPCFLRSARERAEQAHIIIVNHALLLSDLVHGNNLIPDYQHLIIDEAHHLEDEATRQWEFQVPADRLDDALEQQGLLTNELRIALRAGGLASPVSLEAEKVLADVEMCPPLLREHRARLWGVAERLLNVHRSDPSDDQMQLLLRPSAFKGPGQQAWADLGINWENLDSRLQQAIDALSRLQRFLESTPVPSANDQATMATEAATAQANLEQLREQMGSIINASDNSKIHWIDQNHGRGEVTFHSAPLEIGATLAQQLFARKESVIMTSATLSTEGDFGYFKDRTGVPAESAEMVVGSPFDYQKAALLLIPEDMPLPTADGYIEALSRTLADLAKALDGRTMALFTSYSSLRAVSNQVRPRLTSQGIQVLAQGTDGSPQQLTARFSEEPRSLLLGTSSFWEGVDLPGGILKAVVLARLPFQVPTDPIVRSRSEQYQDPFKEYSIPQAVLRFRQGIGRLIRGKGDRGAIVVLDRRITGRSYGHSFLRSIPPCTLKPSTVSTVGTLAADWVGERREAKDRTAV